MPEDDHDQLTALRAQVDGIETRIRGHVPDRCIRVDAAISEIRQDISGIQSTLQWMWRTLVGAGVAVLVSWLSQHLRY